MALAITSFTPITGPVTGGTSVTITGTGLDTVLTAGAVLVGTEEASIDLNAANSATSLTFFTPAGIAAAAVKVTAFDGTTSVVSATSFTYTVVVTPELTPTLTADWVFQVSPSKSGNDWIKARGMQSFAPTVDQTMQDSTTFDDVQDGLSWKSQTPTQLGWTVAADFQRSIAAGAIHDPGQNVLWAAHDKGGAAGEVLIRWYDANGGEEAYEGTATVAWTEKGGDLTTLRVVTVTLTGKGARQKITNPVAV